MESGIHELKPAVTAKIIFCNSFIKCAIKLSRVM